MKSVTCLSQQMISVKSELSVSPGDDALTPLDIAGGHTLSGAVIEPTALNELFPDWKNMDVCITDVFTVHFQLHSK